MLPDGDKQYLQANLRRNRVVLFLGAGFSTEAENFAGETLPLSRSLAEKLWKLLDYPGDYDGTELRYLYDAARKRKGDATVRIFLRDVLTVAKYPEWYKKVSGWYWRRIYTTNIDNLVEAVFAGTPGIAPLDRIVAPDDFVDRDAFLRKIQYVKLHGSADDMEKPIVFSPIEYGKRASLHDIWYDHFLRDYSTHPTVLVGTDLNEPLFWQYLATRQEKPRGSPESRPKSFLVSPIISKARAEALSVFNIEPVEARAQDFFEWLSQLADFRSPREVVLLDVDPTLEELVALEKAGVTRTELQAAEVFFTTFEQVRPLAAAPSTRRDFLLGAQPGWYDIAKNLDADREGNKQVADTLRSVYAKAQNQVPVVVLHGSAGSGKSTTIMRVAYTLALEGVAVYFATGLKRPDPRLICTYLRSLRTRPILVFDNAAPDIRLIQELQTEAERLAVKPVILVSLDQTSGFKRGTYFKRVRNSQISRSRTSRRMT